MKKKNKPLNTKILKRITNRVKYSETLDEDGQIIYQLHQKNFEGDWVLLLSTNRIKRMIQRKHNAWRVNIYNMGLFGFFRERAKKRKRQKKAMLNSK